MTKKCAGASAKRRRTRTNVLVCRVLPDRPASCILHPASPRGRAAHKKPVLAPACRRRALAAMFFCGSGVPSFQAVSHVCHLNALNAHQLARQPPTQLLANHVGPPAAQGQAVFQQVLLQLPVPQPDFPALTLQIHDAGDGKVIRSVMEVKMARGLPLTMRVTQVGL